MSLFRAPQVPPQPQRFFTLGQALGIPLSRADAQMVQFEAYYRQHVEILQPQLFKTASAPQVYVAPMPLQVPATPRWPLEWIVENYAFVEFTPGLPLGIPQPVRVNQSAAYFRPRPQDEAAQEAVDQSVTASAPAVQPPMPRQSDQSHAIWRLRADIQQMQQFAPQAFGPVLVPAPDLIGFSTTPDNPPQQSPIYMAQIGTPLSVPIPRQSEQTAAYWRQRVEIQQPLVNTPQFAPAVGLVPPNTFVLPVAQTLRMDAQQLAVEPDIAPLILLKSFVPAQRAPVQLRPEAIRPLYILPQIGAFFSSATIAFQVGRIIVIAEADRSVTVDANRTIKLS